MIVLDLAYWNLRWRPWRELIALQACVARRGKGGTETIADDVLAGKLPQELLKARRNDRLD